MNKYKEFKCYACRIPIMVNVGDISERNYCGTCAMAKISAVGFSHSRGTEDQYE